MPETQPKTQEKTMNTVTMSATCPSHARTDLANINSPIKVPSVANAISSSFIMKRESDPTDWN
jgi:hypothetical protein